MHDWERMDARRQRVRGYALKGWTAKRMAEAEGVCQRLIFKDLDHLSIKLRERISRTPTPRQFEAYTHRREGKTFKAIAEIMNISKVTARKHVAIAEQKLINKGELEK